MNYLSAFFNQSIFNFKYFFNNKRIFYLILIITISVSAISFLFIPYYVGEAIMCQLIVILLTGAIYGSMTYSTRRSTIFKNMNLSYSNKYIYYLSSFLSIYILLISIILIHLLLMILFNWVGVLIIDWPWKESDNVRGYSFIEFQIGAYIYANSLLIMVTFSFAFFTSRFFQQEKSYYSLLIIILVLVFVFGGTFNEYFHSMYNTPDEYWIPMYGSGAYGDTFFYISLFVPWYAPGQIINIISDFTVTHNGVFDYNQNNLSLIRWGDPKIYYDGVWKWNILLIEPFIFITIFVYLGVYFSKKKNLEV